MRREVIVFVVVALALGGAAQACGAPTGDVVPNSPEARATDTRRTAVAEVQRIIANNPTATPLPAPTATPAPTCPNAIWWTEAAATSARRARFRARSWPAAQRLTAPR